MSDRGQQTPSPTGPASGVDTPVEAPASPSPAAGDTPFELTADDGDSAFQLTDAQSNDAPEAPGNRRVRTIVLSSLLAVSLAGAGTIGWFGWKVNAERHTNLATPTTIGALTLDDSEEATTTADYLQTALSAEIAMDKAVGAVYKSGDGKSVLFFGGTTLLWSPDSDLDSAFSLVTGDKSAVTVLKEVDAGALGGTMKCGVTESPDGDLTVCGWADHGSLALAMFTNRPETEAAPLMRELRNATQTRF